MAGLLREVESPSIVPAAEFRSKSRRRKFAAEVRSPKWFAGLAEFLSAEKPSAALRELTSGGERQCYAWAAGDCEPLSSILVELLRGKEGQRVLDYIMRDSRQPWWLRTKRGHRLADALAEADNS